MNKTIGLRVDVDFEIGLTKGVPFLLDFLAAKGLLATFYVTMGPDGFRRNRERIKTQGYVKRIINFNPWKIATRFGPTYLVRQFLGHPGNVGEDHPEILKRILAEGHELGAHGYDHYWWAENIWKGEVERIKQEMEKGLQALQQATGIGPNVWASPNWRCSLVSLQQVEQLGFAYGADLRGHSAFFPVVNDWQGQTPQIPITLPCLHEIKAYLDDGNYDRIIREFKSHLNNTLNIWCIHDYYEGLLERGLFVKLAQSLVGDGYRIMPIRELARNLDSSKLPACNVVKRALPGGRGEVSYQGIKL